MTVHPPTCKVHIFGCAEVRCHTFSFNIFTCMVRWAEPSESVLSVESQKGIIAFFFWGGRGGGGGGRSMNIKPCGGCCSSVFTNSESHVALLFSNSDLRAQSMLNSSALSPKWR